MNVLGIESSCDECAVSLVRDGKEILSNVVFSQIEDHKVFEGVVPELASRLHVEAIVPAYRLALNQSGLKSSDIDGIAVAIQPGLVGSLLVGVNFAKSLAQSLGKPLIGVDHIVAHLYAPHLEYSISYPYLGLLVSGGHSMIVKVLRFDQMEVLGASIDDACGEAFDKVAKFYGLGYPGGKAIDDMAKMGDPTAFLFPKPSLYKGAHTYDVSYSGLKTAVTAQRAKFLRPGREDNLPNLLASFQKTAIDLLLIKLKKAVQDTGITRVVAGGGVAANSYLRATLKEQKGWLVYYPSIDLCTDNGAMIAGLGYHYLHSGISHTLDLSVRSRVPGFKMTQ